MRSILALVLLLAPFAAHAWPAPIRWTHDASRGVAARFDALVDDGVEIIQVPRPTPNAQGIFATTLELTGTAPRRVTLVAVTAEGRRSDPSNAKTFSPPVVEPPPEPTPGERIPVAASAVTASAYEAGSANLPANVVDGSLATRWSALPDGAWVQLDLGAERKVSSIRVAPYNGGSRTSTFDVRVSTDGTTWTTVLARKVTALSVDLQRFAFPEVTARYVRLVGHGNSANAWNSYTELEAWGPAPPPPTLSTPGQASLADAAPAECWTCTTPCKIGWTPASGPVTGYEVTATGAGGSSPTTQVSQPFALVDCVGEVTVRVRSRDAAGNFGPPSPDSLPIHCAPPTGYDVDGDSSLTAGDFARWQEVYSDGCRSLGWPR